MKILFWISLFWVVYAYAGYMALLAIFGLFKRKKITKKDIQPDITMIITAYNEEKSMDKKIRNCLELDYPKERLEIIIVSDASTDKTEKIASRYKSERVSVLRMETRGGKTAAQNYAVGFAKGEILVFSDATTIYKKDALRKLVRNFSDEKIGIAAGEEEFNRNKDSHINREVSLSWKYERILRRFENRFNSLIGVSGCIFAIRKNLYEKLNEGLIEDFALPLSVISKGYRVYLEKEAIGFEETAHKAKEEFKRKTRIVTNGINVLFNNRRLLNPFKNFKVFFQLVSHKVFRWLAPIFLFGLLASSAFLLNEGILYKFFFLAQISCYGLAIVGFKIPFYFCLVNLAALVGIIKFLFGKNKVIWEPIR